MIPFKEEKIKHYLDTCIRYWRDKRDKIKKHKFLSMFTNEKLIADCYIDAFQSVRTSIFDELLK